MSKVSADDSKKSVNRVESVLRTMETEMAEMRFRIAALEAWILDKEHAGILVRTFIQNADNETYLSRSGEWTRETAEAHNLTSATNALHHCRKERFHNVRLVLEIQRASGVALIPVDLPGLRN